MFSLPSMPPYDGLHPAVVHFPIALIFVTPLLIVLAMVWKKQTLGLLVGAAVLMIVGAACAWLATSTGNAAEQEAPRVQVIRQLIQDHEALAETARNLTTLLAVTLIVASLAYAKWQDKLSRGPVFAAGAVFLIANIATALVMVNAAHQGGRLVHEFGVKARLEALAAPVPSGPKGAATSLQGANPN